MAHSDDTVPAQLDLSQRDQILLAGGEVSPAATALVDEAVHDPDPRIRATALGALARQGRLSGHAVVAGLTDPVSAVRIRAAQLAVTVDDGVIPALISCLDAETHVAVAALVALGDRTAVDALPAILSLAETGADPLVHEEVVATVGALGDPAGLPIILAATHGKPALRRRAVAARGGFSGAEVEAALDRLAEDRDWQVRQAVALLRRPPLDGG